MAIENIKNKAFNQVALEQLIAEVKRVSLNDRALAAKNLADKVGAIAVNEGQDVTVANAIAKAVADEATRINAKVGDVPKAEGEETAKTVVAYIQAEIAAANKGADDAVKALDAEFDVKSADEHVSATLTQVDGKITAFTLATDDIASAKGLADEIKRAGDAEKALADRLGVIEGEGEGSIKEAVNTAVTNLVDGAPDALDTLKEIADWIANQDENGVTDAASLLTRVEANAKAIGDEKTRAEAAEKAINDAIGADETEGTIKGRIAALEVLTGTDSVEDQIDAKINALNSTEKSVAGQIVEVEIVQEAGVVTGVSVKDNLAYMTAEEVINVWNATAARAAVEGDESFVG